MIKQQRLTISLILVMLFLVLIGQYCLASPFDFLAIDRLSEGDTAPDFTLNDLSDQEVTLSDLKGKSIILFFWTTWCPHCRAQLLTLSKEYLQTKGKNIEILTVNIQENKSKVESFLKKYKAGFNTVLDLRGKVATLYEVEGVPTFYFISQEGKIIYVSNFLPSNYTEKFLEE